MCIAIPGMLIPLSLELALMLLGLELLLLSVKLLLPIVESLTLLPVTPGSSDDVAFGKRGRVVSTNEEELLSTASCSLGLNAAWVSLLDTRPNSSVLVLFPSRDAKAPVAFTACSSDSGVGDKFCVPLDIPVLLDCVSDVIAD